MQKQDAIDTVTHEQKEIDRPIQNDKKIVVAEKNPVFKLADRFIEIFESHGIHPNEIPRCVPEEYEISLKDLSNQEYLIAKLTPSLIDWVCSTFNIRREWLEVDDNYIYQTKNYYKNEHSLLRMLKSLKEEYFDDLRVIAYKDVKELNCSGERPQKINLLIVVPVLKIDGKVIQKYIPTSTHWDWGYWRSRYQFKGITRTCYKKLSLTFDGYDLDSDTMALLSAGKVFPKNIIDNIFTGYTWYPDDYTDNKTESQCAKETQETKTILEYIKDRRYADVFSKSA